MRKRLLADIQGTHKYEEAAAADYLASRQVGGKARLRDDKHEGFEQRVQLLGAPLVAAHQLRQRRRVLEVAARLQMSRADVSQEAATFLAPQHAAASSSEQMEQPRKQAYSDSLPS